MDTPACRWWAFLVGALILVVATADVVNELQRERNDR